MRLAKVYVFSAKDLSRGFPPTPINFNRCPNRSQLSIQMDSSRSPDRSRSHLPSPQAKTKSPLGAMAIWLLGFDFKTFQVQPMAIYLKTFTWAAKIPSRSKQRTLSCIEERPQDNWKPSSLNTIFLDFRCRFVTYTGHLCWTIYLDMSSFETMC